MTAAGVTGKLWTIGDIVGVLEVWEQENGKHLSGMQRTGQMGRQSLPTLWRREPDGCQTWRRVAGRLSNYPSCIFCLRDRAKSAPMGLPC